MIAGAKTIVGSVCHSSFYFRRYVPSAIHQHTEIYKILYSLKYVIADGKIVPLYFIIMVDTHVFCLIFIYAYLQADFFVAMKVSFIEWMVRVRIMISSAFARI